MSHSAPKKQHSLYALLNWPEQDSYSIISIRKILSPHQELQDGSICKVKNYEHCLTRVIAVGTETEMDKKLVEVIKEDKLTSLSSPKKTQTTSLQFHPDFTFQNTPIAISSPSPHKSFHPPEPDVEWYRQNFTPHKQKQVGKKVDNTAPQLIAENKDSMIAALIGMVEGLQKNMNRMLERMDRLELALSESQRLTTRDIPPPLPPRNTPKSHPVTHDATLTIPPGYLIPVKLTDL